MIDTQREQLAGAFARLDILRSVTDALFDLGDLERLDEASKAADSGPTPTTPETRNAVIATNRLVHLLGYLLRRLLTPKEAAGSVLDTTDDRRKEMEADRVWETFIEILEKPQVRELFTKVEEAQGLAKSLGDDKTGRALGDDKTGRALSEEQAQDLLARLAFLAEKERLITGIAERSRLTYVTGQQQLIARVLERIALGAEGEPSE